MGKKKPERDIVENLWKDNPNEKAHVIAKKVGLIEQMGYDKAIEYVKTVKKRLRKRGELPAALLASDEDRLNDLMVLWAMRQGKMSKRAAYHFLLLNCYYRHRSEDYDTHWGAITDTYERNDQLAERFPLKEAVHICEIALAQYMDSIDEAKNEAAVKKGYPGAGLNYTNKKLIDILEITDEELENLSSIEKE